MCAHFMVGPRPRAFSLADEVGVVMPRPRTAMTVLCSFISPDLEVTDWEEDPILPTISCKESPRLSASAPCLREKEREGGRSWGSRIKGDNPLAPIALTLADLPSLGSSDKHAHS